MKLYSTKKRWKYLLFIIGLLIIGSSLTYTNYIVGKISKEERRKVKLWAEGIKQKAVLVNYTTTLFEKLEEEERKKVELWSNATQLLADPNSKMDLTFLLEVAKNNTSVPVILTDANDNIISYRNFSEDLAEDKARINKELSEIKKIRRPIEVRYDGNKKNLLYYKDSKLFTELKEVMDDLIKSFISEIVINSSSAPVIYYNETEGKIIASGNIDSLTLNDHKKLSAEITYIKSVNTPIEVKLGDEQTNYIYYDNSFILKQLKYYPYIQLFLISIFILFAYWLFSSYRRAEQNQVWAGMAKETAHQLGTPISSLMAWVEILKAKNVDLGIIEEINKDTNRLKTVADRFSKIGSEAELSKTSVDDLLTLNIEYLKKRSAKGITYSFKKHPNKEIFALINTVLFNWVIENLLKNSVDSMIGKGQITVDISNSNNETVIIDISDTGKGINPQDLKTVFEPGFTTKKRGWGLGLSLTKRIVEEYHNGKVFVKKSEVNKGTTFRISLPTIKK